MDLHTLNRATLDRYMRVNPPEIVRSIIYAYISKAEAIAYELNKLSRVQDLPAIVENASSLQEASHNLGVQRVAFAAKQLQAAASQPIAQDKLLSLINSLKNEVTLATAELKRTSVYCQ
jgi:HPt (histidine-containing phosphotransfer) domain-containing protein